MKILTTTLFVLATMALACLPQELAARAVDEHVEITPDARIEFKAVSGEFRFITGSEEGLRIRGSLGDHVEDLLIEGDETQRVIEVREDRSYRGRSGTTQLEIEVPAGVNLRASTVSGDLEIDGLEGEVLQVNSVSGRIRATAVPRQLELGTVSGNIRLKGQGRESSRLKTVSGNLELGDIGGDVEVRSVSGGIELSATDLRLLRVESVSGQVNLDVVPESRSRIEIQNHSGRTRLALPEGLPLDIEARTFSGRIRSDLGGQVESGRGPGQRLDHRHEDGTVRIRLQSFSGDLEIARLD